MTERKHIALITAMVLAVAGLSAVAVANDVGQLDPSVDVKDAPNGTNDTTVAPGGTVYIDVGLNTTQTSTKKFTSPALNVTLPSGWDLDQIRADSGYTFKDKGNTGEWVSLSNRSRSNFTYEINVPGGTASGSYTVDTIGSAINSTTDNRVTDSITTTINVNEPPTANFTFTPNNPTTQDSITFNASASSDTDGSIQTYNFSFGDGDTANLTDPTTSTTKSYADNDTYTVTLTVTDDDGVSNTTTKTVQVDNVAPTAVIAANRTSVQVGGTIAFNNSTSSDPDGSIVNNSWEFGDGDTANGASVTHSYSSAGTYQVNLTTTDDDGATNTTNITVDVSARPNVDLVANRTNVDTGQTIEFDGSGSSDPDGTIQFYNFSFGDGNSTSQTSPTVNKSYADNNTYTVTLTVEDNDGLTNSTSLTVTVNNRPPTAVINANKTTVNVSETISFDGTGSSDPDGSVAAYNWEFGDGNTTTGASVTKSYSSAGTYQVNLTTTDDDGATNTTSVNITVNAPPVADFGFGQASSAATINETISFSGLSSNDPDGSISSYSWNFDDGNTSTGQNASNVYSNDQTYNVTLTVEDSDGLTDSTTKSVNVQPCRKLALSRFNTVDQRIDLYEIQFGISWYQTDSVVVGSGERFGTSTPPYPSNSALAEIQNRINDWQTSTTVSC